MTIVHKTLLLSILCVPVIAGMESDAEVINRFGTRQDEIQSLLQRPTLVEEREIEVVKRGTSHSTPKIFGPNQRYVAYTINEETRVFDRITGLCIFEGYASDVTCSSDGKLMAIRQSDSQVRIFDLATSTFNEERYYARGDFFFSGDNTCLHCYESSKQEQEKNVCCVYTIKPKINAPSPDSSEKKPQETVTKDTPKLGLGEKISVHNGCVSVENTTGTLIIRRPGSRMNHVGDFLDIIDGNSHELWDTAAKKCVFGCTCSDVHYLPSVKLFIVENHDPVCMAVFNQEGECLFEYDGVCKYSPDEKKLLTLNTEGEVIVYELPSMNILVRDDRWTSVGVMRSTDIHQILSNYIGLYDQFMVLQGDNRIRIHDLTKKSQDHDTFYTVNGTIGAFDAEPVLTIFDRDGQPRIFDLFTRKFIYTFNQQEVHFLGNGSIAEVVKTDGKHVYLLNKYQPAVRMLIAKITAKKGVLDKEEIKNLRPIYDIMSEGEKSTIIAGRTIREIFQTVNA